MAAVLLIDFSVRLLQEMLFWLFLLPVVPTEEQVPEAPSPLEAEERGETEARELSLNLAPVIEVQALTGIPKPSPDLSNR